MSEQQKFDRISERIESGYFTFIPRTARPTSGKSINLTSIYSLEVANDSIISFLPYFGRAYSPIIDPSEGGIKFTSTNFEYKKVEKKNSWYITIRPKDQRRSLDLYLNVYSNGTADLRVQEFNRQPISFYGEIDDYK